MIELYPISAWTDKMILAADAQKLLNPEGKDVKGFDVAIRWGKEGNFSTGAIDTPYNELIVVADGDPDLHPGDGELREMDNQQYIYEYKEYKVNGNPAVVFIRAKRPDFPEKSEIICISEMKDWIEQEF